jgi:hypothetical protein
MTLSTKLMAAFIAIATVSAGNGFAQTAAPSTPSSAPATQSLAVTPIPPETQAEEANLIRSKIERAGYTDVSVLERDNWGVWRGRAKKGDSVVNVVVDKGGRIKMEPSR